MRIVVDIDGTICTETGIYTEAKPFPEKIKLLNELYSQGVTLIYHTGRHWNHLDLTISQLKEWGVKYDTLVMGKPVGDHYIDDRSVQGVEELFNKLMDVKK